MLRERWGVDISFIALPVLFQLLLLLAALKLSGLKESEIGWLCPSQNAAIKLSAGAAFGLAKFVGVSAWLGHLTDVLHVTAIGAHGAIAHAVSFSYGVEELCNRGVVYTLIRRKIGRWPAVLLSSAVFAFGHYTLGDVLVPFGVSSGEYGGYALSSWWRYLGSGVAYCLLLDWSKWIAVPIVAHGVYNVLMSLHS